MKTVIIFGVVLLVILICIVSVGLWKLSNEFMKQWHPLTKEDIKIMSDRFVNEIMGAL